jgi:putative nucleotidyltransferase with HDIG domain
MFATQQSLHPNAKHSIFMLPESSVQYFKSLEPSHATPSRLTMYEKSIKSLPQPPALWQAFQKACDQEASNKVLGNIIKDDPVLAAAILRIANAPGLGVRIAITDIGRAIAHLGTSLVRSIVSHHSFSGTFAASGKVYDIQRLWKHGMAVSALAEIIAKYVPNCHPETASTLGLFHDIGKMSLNLFTQYQQPTTLDIDHGHLVFEYKRFACTHIDLGILLAKHWELPQAIVEGITYHHHPAFAEASDIPETIRAEVFAVYLADILAIYLGFDTGDSGITMPHPSFEALLPHTTLTEILQQPQVHQEMKRIEEMKF